MLNSNQPNQLSGNMPLSEKITVWVFHDARPGHLSQLEGISKRLAFHSRCEFHWFDLTQKKLGFQHIFFLPNFLKTHGKPNLILAAGHSTHLSLLIAGIKYKAFTSVIMKPSLPLCFFNAVICPKHDGLKNSKKVLNTFGPINKIDQTNAGLPTKKTLNTILLGGISKHFHFDEHQILKQIKNICLKEPDKQWILSNSPRTPKSTNKALAELTYPNLNFYDYKSDKIGSLQDILKQTNITVMTPDSMSMIFEALSAGSKIRLIQCEAKNNKRIVKQIDNLIEEGYIEKPDHPQTRVPTRNKFPWEADRAAKWLLKQLQTTHFYRNEYLHKP